MAHSMKNWSADEWCKFMFWLAILVLFVRGCW